MGSELQKVGQGGFRSRTPRACSLRGDELPPRPCYGRGKRFRSFLESMIHFAGIGGGLGIEAWAAAEYWPEAAGIDWPER